MPYDKRIKTLAGNLRKNMTREEKHLWYDFLRNYRVRFVRQMPIGDYIVDFYCPKAKLAVELDGSQHYNAANEVKDSIRTEFLNEVGIEVMRIPNIEINQNFDGACEYIDCYIKNKIQMT